MDLFCRKAENEKCLKILPGAAAVNKMFRSYNAADGCERGFEMLYESLVKKNKIHDWAQSCEKKNKKIFRIQYKYGSYNINIPYNDQMALDTERHFIIPEINCLSLWYLY